MSRRSVEAVSLRLPIVSTPDGFPDTAPDPLCSAQRSIAFLEAMLEGLCDGVMALDQHARVLYWSPSCERLAGLSAASAVGAMAGDVLGELLAARLREVEEGTVEGLLDTPAGPVPVRAIVVRVGGPGGVHIGKACAIRDLRGELEHRASGERAAALAELGKSVACAVHQVRNPLGAAAGFADLLARDLRDSPAAGLLEKIREGLREMDRRIGEILTYARPRPLQSEQVDLARLMAQVVEEVGARFSDGPVLEMDLACQGPLMADALQLRQALENLLVNAAEATGPRGRVTVLLQGGQLPRGRMPGGTLRLLIRNTGGGLAPETLTAMFEPFASSKSRGTGLGLPLAKRIIAAHGGSIEADSGGGCTTFVVTLPREATYSRQQQRAGGNFGLDENGRQQADGSAGSRLAAG